MGLARSLLFFFNDTATTEIYTLSLHDALPISWAPATAPRSPSSWHSAAWRRPGRTGARCVHRHAADRKSTRLNSSHSQISYAVFCLTKKRLSTDRLAGLSPLAQRWLL